MFIITLTYKVEISEVDKYLKPHIDFLNKFTNNGTFILAGRKVPRSGGVIIATTSNKDDLDVIISKDPFKINDVAEFEVQEFVPSIVCSNLEHLHQD